MLKIKELLAKMLGQCEFKELIWTNPNKSITSTHPGGDIDIAKNLEKYFGFEVVFRRYYERQEVVNAKYYRNQAIDSGMFAPIGAVKETAFENTHAHERNTESSYSCNTIKKLAGKYSNLADKCSDSCNYASGWLQSNRGNWSIFKFRRIASAYIDKCRWYSYLWLYIKQNDSSNYIGYDNNNPLHQGKPVLIAKGVA